LVVPLDCRNFAPLLLLMMLEIGLRLGNYGYPTGFYIESGSEGSA